MRAGEVVDRPVHEIASMTGHAEAIRLGRMNVENGACDHSEKPGDEPRVNSRDTDHAHTSGHAFSGRNSVRGHVTSTA
jgi:hypothetical protein